MYCLSNVVLFVKGSELTLILNYPRGCFSTALRTSLIRDQLVHATHPFLIKLIRPPVVKNPLD